MHRDQLKIAEPCHADWNAMSGDQRRRFCGSCSKHVHDLTAMTARSAERLMAKSGDRCVRYASDANGNVIHAPSRLTRLAAVGAALLGASPALAAPQPADPGAPGIVERLVVRVQTAADAWSAASEQTEMSEMGDVAAPPVIQVQGGLTARPEPRPREPEMGKVAAPPTILLPPAPPPAPPVMHLPTPAPGETVIAEVEEALRNVR